MKEHCRNIYQTARRTAGSTQEHWAEQIGVSVEAVRQYEGGIIMPSDEVVLRMAEVSVPQGKAGRSQWERPFSLRFAPATGPVRQSGE